MDGSSCSFFYGMKEVFVQIITGRNHEIEEEEKEVLLVGGSLDCLCIKVEMVV